MKKIIFIIILLINHSGKSEIKDQLKECVLKLPSYIYYSSDIDKKTLSKAVSTISNCSNQTMMGITDTLQGINGRIPASYLNNIFKTKNTKLITNSNFITIEPIGEPIRKAIVGKKQIKLLELKHNLKKFILLSGKEVKIKLLDDQRGVLFYKNKQNEFNFDFMTEINSFVSNETLYPYSSDLKNGKNIIISKTKVWNSKSNDYFIPFGEKDINDYNLIRIVKKDSPIKINDVSLKKVIRIGSVTTVLLQSNGLTIKTTGVAKTSGKPGEYIEVKLENKKTVRGIIQKGKEYYVKI